MNNANIFSRHPHEVGMSYAQHMRFALRLARKSIGCAMASLIHAFLPFLFVTHTSTTIRQLNEIFDQRSAASLQNETESTK